MSVSSAEQVRIGFFFPVNWKARVRFYLFCMLLSLLLHWLLVATTPDDWWHVEPKVAKSRDLMVEVIAEEDIPDQWRYFESNPNVPSHVPTDTPLISDKDQQAAQPEPAPEIDELLPALEGDMEEANKVVSGERPMTPEEIAELLEPVTPAELATMGGGGAPQPSTTTEETAQTEGEPGGIHNEQAHEEDVQMELPENRHVVFGPQRSDMPGEGVATTPNPVQDQQRRQPRPRPKLQPTTLPGPVLASRRGSSHIGSIAVSTRFHEFGDYLSRLIETIGHQWYTLVDETFKSSTMSAGTVKLRFTLNQQGEVSNVQILDSQGATRQAVFICQDAVLAISPFMTWSEAMISLLGDSQEITINFIYGP